ncbi:uncharacterized protein LOC118566637 isoform X2 [Fundulus heteroclitus]|uniref:uncharacterized protein LOC118566637 isoform X2 n=1 Tax=Fundulus heteroclitus TaxID=8078 RepID=UPI00165CE34F|nr:uncharacterized protein LOC118566637 isoform X2 [Fundulus heteroclitus]
MTAARKKRLKDQSDARIVERPADGFPLRIGNLEEGNDKNDFVVPSHFPAEFSSGDDGEDDDYESDSSCSSLPAGAGIQVVSSDESGHSSGDTEEEDAGVVDVPPPRRKIVQQLLPNFRILWDIEEPEEPLKHEEDAKPRRTSQRPRVLLSSEDEGEDEDESGCSCSDLSEAASVQVVSTKESGHSSWDAGKEDAGVVDTSVFFPSVKSRGTSPRPYVLHISEDEGEDVDCSFSALLEAAGVQVVSGEESGHSGCFDEDLAPLACPMWMNTEEGLREEQSPQEPTLSSSGISKKRRREEGAEEEEHCIKKTKKSVPQEKLTLGESRPSTPGVRSPGRPEAEEDFEDPQPSTSWGSTWGSSIAWWYRPKNESESDSD